MQIFQRNIFTVLNQSARLISITVSHLKNHTRFCLRSFIINQTQQSRFQLHCFAHIRKRRPTAPCDILFRIINLGNTFRQTPVISYERKLSILNNIFRLRMNLHGHVAITHFGYCHFWNSRVSRSYCKVPEFDIFALVYNKTSHFPMCYNMSTLTVNRYIFKSFQP